MSDFPTSSIIYNGDQSRLFYANIPNHTNVSQEISTNMSGVNILKYKARVTLMFCTTDYG